MPDPPLLASAAPVITVADSVQGDLARDLLYLDVEEDTDGLKTLRLHLIAAGGSADPATGTFNYLDGKVLDFGKALSVSVGVAGNERQIFKGTISALQAGFAEGQPPDVAVFAEDALMKLRMTQRSKTYERVTDAQIAEQIGGEHGLTVEADADGPTYDVVQQLDQSDLAFLRDRARRVQAEIWAQDQTLCFKSRSARTAPAVTLVQGNQLLAARVRADLAHQRTKVTVTGYDAARRASISEDAGADVVQAEISGGRTGPSVLESALGARPVQFARDVPLTGDEATAWAKAEMLRRSRGFVVIEATTSGTPDLTVGSHVRLERVGSPFAGDGYYVTRVQHTYDLRQGLRTMFCAERATLAEAAA